MKQDLLERFIECATEAKRGYLQRNHCIAAVRVAKECLEPLGFHVEPMPVKLIVQSEEHKVAYIIGASPEEQQRLSRRASSEHRPSPNPWNGHLICLIDRRWILDPSFDQASAPDHGMPIDEMLLIDTDGCMVEPIDPLDLAIDADLTLNSGLRVKVTYQPTKDMSFLTAPAWETDHIEPLIRSIGALII